MKKLYQPMKKLKKIKTINYVNHFKKPQVFLGNVGNIPAAADATCSAVMGRWFGYRNNKDFKNEAFNKTIVVA